MVSEYRFLRFEIAGLVTTVFYVLMTWPLVPTALKRTALAGFESSLAVVAVLFLISLPLGYWEHQLVVSSYRSDKKTRKVHQILRDIILQDPEIKKGFGSDTATFFARFDKRDENSFLTMLSELCIYSEELKLRPDVYERLSDRWSHFYARKAVAVYAPIFAVVLWVATAAWGYHAQWPIEFGRVLVSLVLWAVLATINFILINPYSAKIWSEINILEAEIVLAKRDKVLQVVSPLVKSNYVQYLTGVK